MKTVMNTATNRASLLALAGFTNGVVDNSYAEAVSNYFFGIVNYHAPEITSFTNNRGTLEYGQTVASTTLGWTLTGSTVTTQYMTFVGNLAPSLRTAINTDGEGTNRTYTLTVSDGTNSATSSSAVLFSSKRYWGASGLTSLADSDIIALSSDFTTSRQQSRVITAAAQYVYFAFPTSYGVGTFVVNGLLNTDFTLTVRTFTNASGGVLGFNIYRSGNLLTGTYGITVQ
jgi:hypothetical protein